MVLSARDIELLDQFASHALTGMCADGCMRSDLTDENIATRAYAVAKAMLVADTELRKQGHETSEAPANRGS